MTRYKHMDLTGRALDVPKRRFAAVAGDQRPGLSPPPHPLMDLCETDSYQHVAQTLESRSPQSSEPWELSVAAPGGWPALAAVAVPSPGSRLRGSPGWQPAG
jgi:hypothetical protein